MPKIRSQILALGTVVALIFSLIIFSIPAVSAVPLYSSHSPIYILNNNFSYANGVSSGSGTENDPYIIQNWVIDATYSPYQAGIFIGSSVAYFIIRNCWILNGAANINLVDGIKLSSVTNGRLESNFLTNNGYGICLSSSSSCSITGNISENNYEGVGLINSSNGNLINSNICDNNIYDGIYLDSSENNTIINDNICNNSQYGIDVHLSHGNNIYLNYLYNNIDNNASSWGSNNWDHFNLGNCWSDWQPGMDSLTDTDNNGIVDQPRPVSNLFHPTENGIDHYPLVYGILPAGVQSIVQNIYVYVTVPVTALPTLVPTAGVSDLVALFCHFTGETPTNAPMACMMIGSFFIFIPLFIVGAGIASKSGKYSGLVILTFGLTGMLICIMTGLFPVWFLPFTVAVIALILARTWM